MKAFHFSKKTLLLQITNHILLRIDARIMHWWCTGDALMMRGWCAHDLLLIHRWYTCDARKMHGWCTDDALMMRGWCTADALWCTDDALLMHFWCTDDAPMMRGWGADDTLMMHLWSGDDARMMHWRCIDDSPMWHWWCTCVIFDILESSSFQKYSIYRVFCAVWWYDDHHMIIWWSSYEDMMMMTRCQDHILTENIWFVWSKTSYSGDKWRCNGCGTNDEQTREDRALSQWAPGRLSEQQLTQWVTENGKIKTTNGYFKVLSMWRQW